MDVVTTWRGVADITVDVHPDAHVALESDPAAASILVDLVQEACSNAIRHGVARTLAITVTSDDRVVCLELADDGAAFPDTPATDGLGKQFLRECAVTWSRSREGTRNRLTLAIPISANGGSPRSTLPL